MTLVDSSTTLGHRVHRRIKIMSSGSSTGLKTSANPVDLIHFIADVDYIKADIEIDLDFLV